MPVRFIRLLRCTLTVVGLSNLSGEAKYKKLAEDNVRYYFRHYQDKSGLLWGGHRFIDRNTLQPEGPGEKEKVHELKNAYPYYDLMFAVEVVQTQARRTVKT